MWKVLAALGLVVAVVGGVVSWSAVGGLDDEWAAWTAARQDVNDLERTLGARLDEQLGMAGTDGGFPTGDDRLTALLDDLAAAGGEDAALLAQGVVDREAEIHTQVLVGGGPDEVLLVGLAGTVRELGDAVVDPHRDRVSDVRGLARTSIALTAGASAVLWAAALLLRRSAPRPAGERSPPGAAARA
jgi:hypothetical protein